LPLQPPTKGNKNKFSAFIAIPSSQEWSRTVLDHSWLLGFHLHLFSVKAYTPLKKANNQKSQ
jgi:hypothetical protein